MNRVELYYHKTRQSSWKGLLFSIIACMILLFVFIVFRYYYQSTIKIEAPNEKPGQKVVVYLPNGQKVYTYDHLIQEKDGKTYYKGERNTIDLTGGAVTYEEWK